MTFFSDTVRYFGYQAGWPDNCHSCIYHPATTDTIFDPEDTDISDVHH